MKVKKFKTIQSATKAAGKLMSQGHHVDFMKPTGCDFYFLSVASGYKFLGVDGLLHGCNPATIYWI